MKYLLSCIIALVFTVHTKAQVKKVTIQWSTNAPLNSGSKKMIPNAENLDATLTENNILRLSTTWKTNGLRYSDEINNPVFENIEANSLGSIDKKSIKNKVTLISTFSNARGIEYQTINFNPIIKSGGGFKKIVSFTLKSTTKKNFVSQKYRKKLSITSSILASGNWHRFKIDKTGVYMITPQFLESIGVNLNGVNPNTIKIYGYGGKSLPLRNNENLFFDTPEVPVKITGAEDGVFSGSDTILFYGVGSQGYVEENLSHINPYDDNTYYYVTTGGNPSKKIQPIIEPTATATTQLNNYDFYTYYEKDLTNIGGVGRIWHGDAFDIETTKRFDFTIPDIVAKSPITMAIKFSAVYGSAPSLNVKTFASSQELGSLNYSNFPNKLDTSSTPYATIEQTADVSGFSGNSFNVSLNYDKGSDPSSIGYLDFIKVKAKSILKDYGKQFSFSNAVTSTTSGVGQFNLSNASNVMAVWDVTNPYIISEKIHNNSEQLAIKFNFGTLKKFVSINKSDIYTPTKASNSVVVNQNLKGMIFNDASGNTKNIDYLIITNNDYVSAASRLADFRRKQNGFNVKIVTLDKIYNEFSNGKQDIGAIRNFVKYVYDNPTKDADPLKYLCIIGDGSYDYKDRISNNRSNIKNTNDVPLFHALNSSSFANSFATDDFYGFMDDNEGGNSDDNDLDIAIGRIVAPDLGTANNMVDKIIRYYDPKALGDWRNSLLFVSDDVDLLTDAQIQTKLDQIAEGLKTRLENGNVKKLFTDAFKQEVSPGGERYPKVRRRFLDIFELGVSYVNYFGHGGENGLAGESIFNTQDAKVLSNTERMPVFITLTCELTRFDNPLRATAGEFMYWNNKGGAVALLTTTRNLFVQTGLNLNDSLAESIFDDQGNAVPIGEALRLAKVKLSTNNKRTVFCVGDPALTIAFPKPKINLTQINNIDLASVTEPLKALDKVKLSGQVVNPTTNAVLKDFNGEISVVLFDKSIERTTLANDGIKDAASNLIKLDFIESGGKVFRGLASVKAGIFDIEFVLPRNVKLPIGEGKVSFYAKNNSKLTDQSGSQKIQIGGLNTNAAEDTQAPTIDIFLNDENFVSGQTVNDSPILLVKFSDQNGINTSGGVGHDIIAIIDGDDKNPIVLNDYYSTSLDNYTTGDLSFKLRNLSPGEHTLKIRASDTYNNAVFEEITFIVNEIGDFALNSVLNYPNPFVSYTEFRFKHNAGPTENLETMVQIMTVTGKVIKTLHATTLGSATYNGTIRWDGKDDFGDKIGKGVYIYKISVKSPILNKTATKIEKLVIL